MKRVLTNLALALLLAVPGTASSEPQQAAPQATPQATPSVSAPAFIRLDGELKTETGAARDGSVVLVVSLYAAQDDPAPLWSETQAVSLDAAGRYTVFAGATLPEGLPREFFSSNSAQWIGIAVQGEPEQPRARMVSVPYALSAGNADSLGGVPATNFVMTDNLAESVKKVLDGDDAPAAKGEAGGPGDPSVSGTSGRIPKFDASGLAANIVDSVMFEGSSRIGIGTTSPGAALDVAPTGIRVNSNGVAVSGFVDGLNMGTWDMFGYPAAEGDQIAIGGYRASQWQGIRFYTNGTEKARITAAGRIGVGTTTPQAGIDIANGPIRVNSNGVAVSGFIDGLNMGTWDMFGYPLSGGNYIAIGGYRASQWDSLAFFTSGSEKIRVDTSGNVGIGITTPTAKLHVVGTAYVTGNVTVDGNIGAKYQDVAEWVETGEKLEDGTVVIVAPDAIDSVVPSPGAYDTRVAGAVSRQPGLILGVAGESKSLIAQSGRVKVKVDASFGAIKAGDLLVTSPTPGHAMLSKPIKVGGQKMHRPGTLVGKALEGLANGKGEILVLLTLQ
jgi:hypothetical protein